MSKLIKHRVGLLKSIYAHLTYITSKSNEYIIPSVVLFS